MVRYDGDTERVGAVSLMNGSPTVNDRVMMLQVPPAGNFILGRFSGLGGTPNTVKQYTSYRGREVSAGDVVLTVASQVVTPLLTLQLSSPGDYLIIGSADLDQTASGGNNVGAATLQVNGVGQTDQILFGVTAAGQRAVLSKAWYGSIAAGTNTFQLIASKSLNIGTFTCRAVGTGYAYQIWQ